MDLWRPWNGIGSCPYRNGHTIWQHRTALIDPVWMQFDGDHCFSSEKNAARTQGRLALNLFGFEDTNDRMCERGVYMHAAPIWMHHGSKLIAENRAAAGVSGVSYEDRDLVFGEISGAVWFVLLEINSAERIRIGEAPRHSRLRSAALKWLILRRLDLIVHEIFPP